MRRFPTRSLWKSKKGISQVIAEVLMVLVVLIMSAIVSVYAVSTLTSLTPRNGPAGPESFKVLDAGVGFTYFGQGTPPAGPVVPTNAPYQCTTSNSPITGTVSSAVYVPPGQTCVISTNARVTGSLNIDAGSTVIIQQGAYVGGPTTANGAKEFDVESATITGPANIYNTQQVVLNQSVVSGSLIVSGSSTAQILGNTITGPTTVQYITSVSVIGNRISGSLTFNLDILCSQYNNTVSGSINGVCKNNYLIRVLNNGPGPITIGSVYATGQLTQFVDWTLLSGALGNCGGQFVSWCGQLPIVIPAGDSALIGVPFQVVSTTQQVALVMFSMARNYIEARIDPNLGLVCSTGSLVSPRIAPFC